MNIKLKSMNERLATCSGWSLKIICVLFLTVVGFFDGATGSDFTFSFFYLIPVVFASWYIGRNGALFVATFGSVSWLIADIAVKRHFQYPLSFLWNETMKVSLLFFAANIISLLKRKLDHEEALARTDQLTAIANRRSFWELAGDEIRRSQRYSSPFTVIYLDIDNFKTVNDTLGHDEGDVLLRKVAATLTAAIRESDTVARLGGDEFCLLLPETCDAAAVSASAKIINSLKEHVEKYWPVSFSIGMVTYLKAPANTNEMLQRADQLMYEVKNSGKNELRHLVVADME